MSTEQFPIGAILTVTHGKLMCDIGQVYKILNFMTGDNLYTHQLSRVFEECKPAIMRQHPHLTDWIDDVDGGNVLARLADAERQFGKSLPIATLADGDHERIDALSELAERIHPDNIIVVEKP